MGVKRVFLLPTAESDLPMRLVSFDMFRTLGFEGTTYIKPSHFFAHKPEIQAADWVLFPEYWQVNALVYGLKCRIFPSQSSYLIGHNKIEMTRAFEAVVPENVPVTHIAPNTPTEAERLWALMDLPFVAKLPKASMGEGVWLIEDTRDWQDYLAKTDVLYVQEHLPIDRDIRVVIVGDQVVSAYWRCQSDRSFHNNVSRGGVIDQSDVPQAALDLALKVARLLDVDHAGFDVAMVGSHPYLLEFNRLFGNQGIAGGGETLRNAILAYLRDQSSPTLDPDKPRKQEPVWPQAV
jgi:ribosomal protein S6--L-glutamate ligase